MSFERVHLHQLAHPDLPLRFSHFQQRRARQLHQFFLDLHRCANQQLKAQPRLELLVLESKDWYKMSQSIYGIPFIKGRKALVQLYLPADYPSRFQHKLDELFLLGGFKLPGDVKELFDLLSGFDWARAYLRGLSPQKTEPGKQLEQAAQLYTLALQTAGWDGLLERLVAWLSFSYPSGKIPEAQTVTYQPKSQKALLDRFLVYSQTFQSFEKKSWQDLALATQLGA